MVDLNALAEKELLFRRHILRMHIDKIIYLCLYKSDVFSIGELERIDACIDAMHKPIPPELPKPMYKVFNFVLKIIDIHRDFEFLYDFLQTTDWIKHRGAILVRLDSIRVNIGWPKGGDKYFGFFNGLVMRWEATGHSSTDPTKYRGKYDTARYIFTDCTFIRSNSKYEPFPHQKAFKKHEYDIELRKDNWKPSPQLHYCNDTQRRYLTFVKMGSHIDVPFNYQPLKQIVQTIETPWRSYGPSPKTWDEILYDTDVKESDEWNNVLLEIETNKK